MLISTLNLNLNILKRRQKAKKVSMTYSNDDNARVSVYIKIIGVEKVVFILQKDYKSP